jgi:hypothetical protein
MPYSGQEPDILVKFMNNAVYWYYTGWEQDIDAVRLYPNVDVALLADG